MRIENHFFFVQGPAGWGIYRREVLKWKQGQRRTNKIRCYLVIIPDFDRCLFSFPYDVTYYRSNLSLLSLLTTILNLASFSGSRSVGTIVGKRGWATSQTRPRSSPTRFFDRRHWPRARNIAARSEMEYVLGRPGDSMKFVRYAETFYTSFDYSAVSVLLTSVARITDTINETFV